VLEQWSAALRWRIGGTALEFPVRRLGQVVVHRQLRATRGFEYDRLTAKVIGRVLRGGGRALDVGAHDGLLLRWMVRAAPRAEHIAVEPLPEYAARLRERFAGVHVFEGALSDHDGTAEFGYVPNRPAVSSLSPRAGLAADDVVRLEVQLTTMDALVGAAPVQLVKIDVEGAEHAVLLGGADTIRRDRPVIAFEHGPGAHGGVTVSDMHRLLTVDLGLRVSLLDDWLAGRPSLSEQAMVDAQEQDKHFFFLAHP
jgi:FkbM family methyltransferase